MTSPQFDSEGDVPYRTPGGFDGMQWDTFQDKDESAWRSDIEGGWQSNADGPLGIFGSFIQNLPTLVVVQMLTMLGDLLSNVPIVGETLEDIVDNIAAGLNDTYNTASTANTNANTALTRLNDADGKFVEIEAEMIENGVVQSDHENRIIALESGNVVAEYFSNDVWVHPTSIPGTSPPLAYNSHDLVAVAGGGGGRRPGFGISGARGGSYGGGQGGYGHRLLADGAVASTVNITIGTAGAGATSNNVNGSAGGNATFINGATTYLTCNGGAGGVASTPPVAGTINPIGGTFDEWNASGGRGFGYASGGDIIHPTSGGGGYLAAGGLPGNGTNASGQNGGACPAGRIGPGGGGGGGDMADGGNPKGGNGGFPGGAGGAGGVNGPGTATGNGGNGAIGRSLIISYVSAP